MNQNWVAFLRIVVGIFFAGQGLSKLGWYASSEFLRTSLDRYAQNPPAISAWYQQHVAYSGIDVWARMIPTGEMLIGAALVLGLLTEPTLVIAILLVLNFHLATGTLFSWSFFSNPYALLLCAALLVLLFSKAGGFFSIDFSVRKKKSQGKL